MTVARPPRPRAPVHEAAASPRGASQPHQEGPPDLRLVAPALAAWAAAALALDAPAHLVALVCTVASLVAAALLIEARRRDPATGGRRRSAPHPRPGPDVPSPVPLPHDRQPLEPTPSRPRGAQPRQRARKAPPPTAGRSPGAAPGTYGRPGTGEGHTAPRRQATSPPRTGAWRGRPTAGAVAAVLLCGAAAGAVAGLYGADVRRGPVPALAREYAEATAEVTVTGDPRLTRPRVRGAALAPASVVLEAEADRVTGPDGTTTTTSAPVLVTVHPRAGKERTACSSATRN